MNDLVPEQRLDRNGRSQRRWVRPATAAASRPAQAIPAPDAALLAALQKQGAMTLPSRVGCLADLWKRSPITTTNYTPADFDARAITEIERLLARREDGSSNPPMCLQIAVGEALKLMADEGMPEALHNLAVFGDDFYPFDRGAVTQQLVHLAEYCGRELDYLLDATDDERARAKAFVGFINRAGRLVPGVVELDEELDYYEPVDAKLTALIWTQPERADDVLQVLVQEGGPLPVEVIEERLASGTVALRDGVL